MIRLAIIGLLIITSLSLIFGSCSPKEIEVNIDTFDGNMSKALKSKIIVVKDKIHLIDLGSPFDGKIYLTENSKTVQELEIVKGEIINAKLFDKDGLNIGNYHKIDESLIFETNTDSLVSECNWSEFTNASFINGTLEDEEHTCSIKIKTENTNLTVLLSVKYDKLNKLIINETTGQDKNINKIIFKNIAYKKILNDSTKIIVTFNEDLRKKYNLDNLSGTLYREEIIIEKGIEAANLSTTFSEDGNIFIHASLENYNGKNCSEADALYFNDTFLFGDYKYEESTCVTEGLKIVNATLKNQLSANRLKSRFFEKKKNNFYFSKEQTDIDFYFIKE